MLRAEQRTINAVCLLCRRVGHRVFIRLAIVAQLVVFIIITAGGADTLEISVANTSIQHPASATDLPFEARTHNYFI